MRLDILFVADVRFEGGTSTALAVEIRAAARAGFKTGLLAVKGPLLRRGFQDRLAGREGTIAASPLPYASRLAGTD